jgi:hypothetical protein
MLAPPAASGASGVVPPQPALVAKASETERESKKPRRSRFEDCTKKAINTPPERGTLGNDERSWNTFL